MSATLTPTTQTAPPAAAESTAPRGPVLVATDGSAHADAALRAARELAARCGAPVRVLSVLDPLPVAAPEVMPPLSTEAETQRRADRLAAVHAQMDRTARGVRWPVALDDGHPMATIAGHARALGSRLIVVGLGRHGVKERLFGDETALQLMRLADAPVLAVAPSFAAPPHRIVAALDFSPSSIHALRAAVELAAPDAAIDLVHVVTRDMSNVMWEDWQNAYSTSVMQAFNDARAEAAVPEGCTVKTYVLRGDPAHEILALADRVGADLICTGSHGHGFFARILVGSVTTRIVRGAHCSVLGVARPAVGETP